MKKVFTCLFIISILVACVINSGLLANENVKNRISSFTINIECSPSQSIDLSQDYSLLFDKIPAVPINEYSKALASSLYDLKYYIAGGTAVGLYLFIFYQVLKGTTYVANIHSWSRWKGDILLEELLAIPAASISNDLILEIQRRYTTAEAPADFISPLVLFMKDIDKEISTFKYYNNLFTRLKKIKIAGLFPIKQNVYKIVPDKTNRLIYIRNVFLSWAAQYKVDQHRRYCLN